MIRKLMIVIVFSSSLLHANNCIDDAFAKFQNRKYNQTIKMLKECGNAIQSEDDSELLAKYYYGIGRSYLELGLIDSSLKYELISFNIKEKFGLDKNLNLSYNDLGILYDKIGQTHKSIYFLYKAIKVNLGNKNFNLLTHNYNNLAVSYKHLNLLDSAKKYYAEAIKYIELDVEENKSALYNNIAVLNQDLKLYKASIEYFNLALSFNNVKQIDLLQFKTNKELTNLFLGKKIDTALFSQYLKQAETLRNDYNIADANYKLALINASLPKLSNKYLEKSINILKSLENYNAAILTLQSYNEFLESSKLDMNKSKKVQNELRILLAHQVKKLSENYEKEIQFNLEADKRIDQLQTDIMYSDISFYGLLILILFIFGILYSFYYYITKKKIIELIISKFRDSNQQNNEKISIIKNELGSLTFMLDQRLDPETNKQIYNTLDKAIDKVNSFETNIISNNYKEAECQILQHQQITNG